MDATANGAGKKDLREELRDTRLQARIIQERLKLSQLERLDKIHGQRKQYMEAADQWNYLSTYQDLLDRMRQPDGVLLTPLSTAADRRYGANWPFWRTWADHAKLRGISRLLVGISNQAQGGLNGLAAYTIGPGFTYRAIARQDMEPPPELLRAVNACLEEFQEENDWAALEKELFLRFHRDGEYATRDFVRDDGVTIVRTVEPEYIIEGPNTDDEGRRYDRLGEYSFGVFTPEDDVQAQVGYNVSYLGSPSTAEFVSTASMSLVTNGVDRAIKRGMPDFVFDTYDLLKIVSRCLLNMGEATAIQSAIAFIREHQTALPGDITAFQQGLADYQKPNPFNGAQTNVQRVGSGTVWDVGQGHKYVVPPFALNAQNYAQVAQLLMRVVGVKWNAPEWLFSGDASNNAYASSLTAESPFVIRIHEFQAFHRGKNKKQMWRAIRNKCGHEGLRVGDQVVPWRVVYALVDIQVESPTVEVQDPLQEAQSNLIKKQAGVLSTQTWQQKEGLDSEDEFTNMEEYEARFGMGDALGLPPEQVPAVKATTPDANIGEGGK